MVAHPTRANTRERWRSSKLTVRRRIGVNATRPFKRIHLRKQIDIAARSGNVLSPQRRIARPLLEHALYLLDDFRPLSRCESIPLRKSARLGNKLAELFAKASSLRNFQSLRQNGLRR